jgi:AcrR family transcriptional regulator
VQEKSACYESDGPSLLSLLGFFIDDDGSNATVESVAVLAEKSISTIYKHFPNREDLFRTALLSGMKEWETWAIDLVSGITDPIEGLLFPIRLQVKLPETHPTFAKMVVADIPLFLAVAQEALPRFGENILKLQRSKVITSADIKVRVQNMSMLLTMILLSRCSTPPLPEKEALYRISIALEMLGLTTDQIKQAWTAPLPDVSNS